MASNALEGANILVTRPREQAAELIAAIESAGGRAIAFPALDIEPLDPGAVRTAADMLRAPDIAVFVSPNAVRFGLDFAGRGQIAAVGPATAAALEAEARTVNITPVDGYDSESLLRTAAMHDVDNKVIRIIRATDGRQVLGDELHSRGAHVDYLATYRRTSVSPSGTLLREVATAWQSDNIQSMVVMSVDTLTNLLELLPQACVEQFEKVRLVTPAARVIKDTLKRFPNARTELATGTDTMALVAALEKTL